MKFSDLHTVTIVGLGLLGGSTGMALCRSCPGVKRVGYSHREVTRGRAQALGLVDEIYDNLPEAVSGSQLVVLASPIGTFEALMQEMAPHLAAGCVVTDVGSTKVLPVRWARRYLPKQVEFLGSHPMAGSEQRGVEFARADLLDGAQCILTPTAATKGGTIKFIKTFWRQLGMRVCQMTPAKHDRVLAQISHLPHVLASALVNCSDAEQMLLCGRGFLDTTRIASGPPGVWRDILMANADNTDAAIGRLIKELTRMQKILQKKDAKATLNFFSKAQAKRNDLVARKLKRKELPG